MGDGGIGVSVKVFGAKDTIDALKAMGVKVVPISSKAASKSMTTVSKKMKANVRGYSRNLAKSIGKKTKTYRRSGTTIVSVGPRLKYQWINSRGTVTVAAKIAHLVESGTAPHVIQSNRGMSNIGDSAEGSEEFYGKTVQHPGTDARPFIRPSLISSRRKVENKYMREIKVGIEKEARKQAARTAGVK